MSRARAAGDGGEERAALFGRSLWRLLPAVLSYRRRIVLGLGANALARSFDLFPMVLAGRVVDAVTAAGKTGAVVSGTTFLWYGLLVMATFLGLALFQSVSDYQLDTMAEHVRHELRTRLYSHLQRLDLGYFEDRQAGDLMAVVAADVDNLERFFSDVTTSVVRLTVTFAGVYGILLFLDWRLALLMLIPLPFALAAVRFFAVRVQPEYRRARKAVGQVNALIENNLQGMGVIQAYTSEAVQEERVRRVSAEYRDASVAAIRERSRFVPLIYAVAGSGFALLIAGGGWLTFAGYGPTPGDYTTFVLLAMRLILPMFVFGMLMGQLQRSEASAARICELLDTVPRVADAPDAAELAGPLSRVEIRDVRYAYPGRDPALRGVSLTLSRGRSIGVVGPTGAGKSTLVKLVLRYFEPADGALTADGAPLSRVTLASWRRQIGYVSQEPFLFYGTVAENIRLGSPDASDEALREAARVAGAEEFIERLPQGYATMVGERGVKLSGGQRQRISLARAVLRDPALLVLDEATSSVDTRTEEVIQKNLLGLREGRMTLAVAHRLSTVRHCDEILVLVDGVVAERGDHDELVAAGGVYAGLWAVQSGEASKGSGEPKPPGAPDSPHMADGPGEDEAADMAEAIARGGDTGL